MADAPLKLSARDADDLAVIAACVQDALVPIGEMAFLPAERRFVLALNRFRWDLVDPKQAPRAGRTQATPGTRRDASFSDRGGDRPRYERVLSGLRFEGVKQVRKRGIDLHNRDRILELLTIQAEPGALLLLFAGGASIRLDIDELRCYLEDFGEGWPTRWRPSHPEEDETKEPG
jgi:hypothetical protein